MDRVIISAFRGIADSSSFIPPTFDGKLLMLTALRSECGANGFPVSSLQLFTVKLQVADIYRKLGLYPGASVIVFCGETELVRFALFKFKVSIDDHASVTGCASCIIS